MDSCALVSLMCLQVTTAASAIVMCLSTLGMLDIHHGHNVKWVTYFRHTVHHTEHLSIDFLNLPLNQTIIIIDCWSLSLLIVGEKHGTSPKRYLVQK